MSFTMKEIAENILNGIVLAHEDYLRWSDGDWLFQAPEYLMTTYIAKEIGNHNQNSCYINLEASVKDAVTQAVNVNLDPYNHLRLGGRFDILLRCEKKEPVAIVEIKKQVSAFDHIEDDVSRICTVLKGVKQVRNGIVAYCSAHNDDISESEIRDFLMERLCNIKKETQDFVRKQGMTAHNHTGAVRIDDGWAWVPEVIVIGRG